MINAQVNGRAEMKPKCQRFPEKLHMILESVDKHGQSHINSWMPHGTSFRVMEKEIFSSSILPKFFGTTKYKSFQRNLNLWGFKTANRSECYHPLFLRGRPELLSRMKREKKAGKNEAASPPSPPFSEQHFVSSPRMEDPSTIAAISTSPLALSLLTPPDSSSRLQESLRALDNLGISTGSLLSASQRGNSAANTISTLSNSNLAAQLAAGGRVNTVNLAAATQVLRELSSGGSPPTPIPDTTLATSPRLLTLESNSEENQSNLSSALASVLISTMHQPARTPPAPSTDDLVIRNALLQSILRNRLLLQSTDATEPIGMV